MATHMHIRQIPLSSNQLLLELIQESLEHIIGTPHTLISNKLPYEGHHLLALDAEDKPVLLCCDNRDGGRALLSALGVLEGLAGNRGWLYRLYPGIFQNDGRHGSVFRIDDMRLIILAPTPPPGGDCLRKAFPRLSCFLTHALEINGEIGLYIEQQGAAESAPATPGEGGVPLNPFRNTPVSLTAEEQACLREPG